LCVSRPLVGFVIATALSSIDDDEMDSDALAEASVEHDSPATVPESEAPTQHVTEGALFLEALSITRVLQCISDIIYVIVLYIASIISRLFLVIMCWLISFRIYIRLIFATRLII
jgi:hypothetical protein